MAVSMITSFKSIRFVTQEYTTNESGFVSTGLPVWLGRIISATASGYLLDLYTNSSGIQGFIVTSISSLQPAANVTFTASVSILNV